LCKNAKVSDTFSNILIFFCSINWISRRIKTFFWGMTICSLIDRQHFLEEPAPFIRPEDEECRLLQTFVITCHTTTQHHIPHDRNVNDTFIFLSNVPSLW
jgi:hypothetical protein